MTHNANGAGNQTTRVSLAVTAADRRERMRRDIQAVLNLRLLCPDDAAEMADALGLTEVAARVERVAGR